MSKLHQWTEAASRRHNRLRSCSGINSNANSNIISKTPAESGNRHFGRFCNGGYSSASTPFLHFAVGVILTTAFQCQMATAALVASSKVERCTRTSAEPEGCNTKLVIALTVASGDVHGSEQVEAMINTAERHAANGGGETTAGPHNTAAGQSATLAAPVLVSLAKDRSTADYPLRYLHSVNNAPWEHVVTTKQDTLFGGHADFFFGGHCTDETCGYATHNLESGVDSDSSGQCCACKFGEQLLGTKHLVSGSRAGQLQCRLFGSAQASAHCMRYDELWYNVYAIETPRVVSKIDVTVMQLQRPSVVEAQPLPANTTTPLPRHPDGNCGILPEADPRSTMRIEMLAVGSQQRQSVTADGSITATFVGDFAAAQAPVDLTGQYLLVPELRGMDSDYIASHPQLQANGGPEDWMLIDKDRFASVKEKGCDKIGVSYTSFKHQASMCDRKVGSCLNNQPKDFWGKGAEFRLASAGPFAVKTDGSSGINSRYLSYPVSEVQDSFLTLSMNADSLRFITNVSPGRILMATIGDFEALGDPGLLAVTIVNEGCLSAKFSVSVRCNAAIVELTAKEASVAPGAVWSVEMPVHTTSQASSNNFCSVTLYDAEGGQLDNWNRTFTTNATCICLGMCACDCDPYPLHVVHCVVESTVAESDTSLRSGDRNGVSGFFGFLDKIGFSLEGFVGILSGIATFVIIFCCLRYGICTLLCKSARSPRAAPPAPSTAAPPPPPSTPSSLPSAASPTLAHPLHSSGVFLHAAQFDSYDAACTSAV